MEYNEVFPLLCFLEISFINFRSPVPASLFGGFNTEEPGRNI